MSVFRLAAPLGALLVLLLMLSGSPVALAHAEPASSNPPIGGTVTESPTQVEVVFTQEVVRQGQDSSITVLDSAGTNVAIGSRAAN